MALGAYGELPWIYLAAWGESRRRDPMAALRAGSPPWPLHDIAVSNFVWCMAYKRGVGGEVVSCVMVVR